MAVRWEKPAEGSWTEHYPDLGTGPISFRDSTSPEFYAQEREAVFKRAWLNLCRIEDLPAAGSTLVKPVEAADDASVLMVKDAGGRIRAFHNSCRHRGHPLVRDHRPGTVTELTCGQCGWSYGLDGALRQVPDVQRYFELDRTAYGLAEIHCDVWAGFVFVNFADEPPQSLREFLGPMVTALDDYPFDKLTERYDWIAHNNSNWKIFADAFQEYYHVPSLHTQQVPPEVRDPNAGFTCGHFQLDGPHRLVSTARKAMSASQNASGGPNQVPTWYSRPTASTVASSPGGPRREQHGEAGGYTNQGALRRSGRTSADLCDCFCR